jgi:hypothetical protein
MQVLGILTLSNVITDFQRFERPYKIEDEGSFFFETSGINNSAAQCNKQALESYTSTQQKSQISHC